MSDLMLYGVLRMPYEMAMSGEISRVQFYDRVQEAANRLEEAEAELEKLRRSTSSVSEAEMPELPARDGDWAGDDWYTASTVREIIAADRRARQGEPVGFFAPISADNLKAGRSTKEWLFRRPQPGDIAVYLAATKAAAPADAPKDHVIREAINQLRDVAVHFHATQQLRARIADIVLPLVKGRAPAEDAREEKLSPAKNSGNRS